jgi:hypothetical protein
MTFGKMANDPFTLCIFVPDGDPEGVRIIDRMNWTGLGIVFPREKWPTTKQRSEFSHPGVYILTGYRSAEDELPTVYIGEDYLLHNRWRYWSGTFHRQAIGFSTKPRRRRPYNDPSHGRGIACALASVWASSGWAS